MIDFENAGSASLNHADPGTGMQSHFFQPDDQFRSAIDFYDDSSFTCSKQFKRHYL